MTIAAWTLRNTGSTGHGRIIEALGDPKSGEGYVSEALESAVGR